MKKHNRELAQAISKRYKASGVIISPEAIVKHLLALCEALDQSDLTLLHEQKSWQQFIGYEQHEHVDDFGLDSDGIFLYGLAKKLRLEYAKAISSKHASRYRQRLLEDNNGLDITPLLRAYDKWLGASN